MLQFTTVIKKFDKQGEKTGWSFIEISEEQAAIINPGIRTSYRVKGKLDNHPIEKVAIMPMGSGAFIMPLNIVIRKALGKGKGNEVTVQLQLDNEPLLHDSDFLECLQDEPAALQTFQSLTRGHQNYFSKWIESAKTSHTKAKRIAMAVNALQKGLGYPEMLRAQKAANQQLGR